MSRRVAVPVAVGAAGFAGYYLYNAGGDPKAAEKRVEYDAARASANVRSHLPGAEKEAKTGGEVLAADAEKAYKDAASQAKDATSKVDAKLEDYRKEAESKLEGARKSTGDELTKAVDKFDKSVEEGASKAKSGISSWFGGK
ncbi:hypothetical protein MBLNU230_g3984t1 [Neophaeotheca triangularis]